MRKYCGAMGLLAGPVADGAAEGRHREDQRIEFLIVPELGEVKADWTRFAESSRFHGFDEPGEPALNRVKLRSLTLPAREVNQYLNRQGGFLHAGWTILGAAPAAIGILDRQQVNDTALTLRRVA